MNKFALVGNGRTAALHAKNIEEWGELKAFCDPEQTIANASTPVEGKAAKAYLSIDDLLANEPEVDVVVVCTQTGFHAEQVIKALQAGKNVVCESPLCLTPAAAWQIVETEKFCRRQLFVVKPVLFHPVLRQLKNYLAQEMLGRIYSFQLTAFRSASDQDCFPGRGKLFPDGGSLYNLFSPFVDVLLWLFGDMTEAKGCKTNAAHQDSIEYEDSGVLALQMEGGVIGTFNWSVNAFQEYKESTLTLLTEKGTIRIGGDFFDDVQLTKTESALPLAGLSQNLTQGLLYQLTYQHLQKAVESGNRTEFRVYGGLKTVEAIDKIYKAISG